VLGGSFAHHSIVTTTTLHPSIFHHPRHTDTQHHQLLSPYSFFTTIPTASAIHSTLHTMAASTPMHTPSDTLQLAIAPHTVNSGAFNQMATEESYLLGLPVELQKTILEYLRTSVPKFDLG
jgi:hypothetical protein